MSQAALLARLEACVQEELAAQGRTLALLRAQEQALLEGRAERVQAGAEACKQEVEASNGRARRRGQVLAELGALWKVDPQALTLGSIVLRAGDAARRLERQRAELRVLFADVARHARRVGAAARAHQKLVGEVLATLLLESGADREQGRLVDAEA